MYTIRTVKILIKLLPSILALRKDRKKWINQNKNEIDPTQFKKNATKVLETFISLGPVYIKLGQWLSSRADILPQPYLQELSKLQDSVPAAPFEQVKPIIEKDIGLINEKFDNIDPVHPCSCAGRDLHARFARQHRHRAAITAPGQRHRRRRYERTEYWPGPYSVQLRHVAQCFVVPG